MTTAQKIQEIESLLKEAGQLQKEVQMDLDRMKQIHRKLSRIHLTNKQAASFFGKSVGTVQRWKRQGLLKSTNALDVLEYAS